LDLHKSAKKDRSLRLFGEDLAHLIQRCDRYDQITEVRDEIIHKNAQTCVFADSSILLQVTKHLENKIDYQGVMLNKNLVDFE
jgi:hypothetical protein